MPTKDRLLKIFSASSTLGRSDRARQTAVDGCCRRPPVGRFPPWYVELMSKDQDVGLQVARELKSPTIAHQINRQRSLIGSIHFV
jgi:hypothetical protein